MPGVGGGAVTNPIEAAGTDPAATGEHLTDPGAPDSDMTEPGAEDPSRPGRATGDRGSGSSAVVGGPRRWVWPVGLGLAVLVPIAVVLVAVSSSWYATGDTALLALRSHDLLVDPPRTGAYSRFGFDHPGPVFLYLSFPFVRLAGSAGPLCAAAAVSAASVLGVVAVAWRRGGRTFAVPAVLVVLLLEAALGPALVDPWNPWVPALPLLAAVLLAWSVTCGDAPALPALVLAATVAAQSHIAYAPFAAVLLAGSAVAAAGQAWRGPGGPTGARWRVPGAVALGLVVVLWLPPVTDQVTSPTPNGTKIIAHFFGSGSGADAGSGLAAFGGSDHPGADRIIGTLAVELGVPGPWTAAGEEVDPFLGAVVPGSPLRLLPTAAAFVVGLLLARRLRRRDLEGLSAIVAGLVAVGALSLSRLTGTVAPYLVRWTWVLAAVIWLQAFWAVAGWVAAQAAAMVGRRPGAARRQPWAARTAAAVILVATVAAGSVVARADPPDQAGAVELAALVDAAVGSASTDGATVVETQGLEAAAVRAGLVAELARRGFEVVVPTEDAARFGTTHRAGEGGRPAAVRLVVAVGDSVFAPDPPGLRLVATYDPMTRAERRDHDALRTRVLAALDDAGHGRPVRAPLSDEERRRWEAGERLPLPARIWAGPVSGG